MILVGHASLLLDGARPALRLERELPQPPPEAWRTLTERDQLRSWFPCDVVVEGGRWQVGATFAFVFPADLIEMTLRGEVLDVDVAKRLAFTWGDDDILRFELSPHGGGSRLVLIDELAPATAARNAAGWDICLDQLAGNRGGPPERWRDLFDLYTKAFEPSLGKQEGPPTAYKGD